ncbi:MAG: DUF2325 domain-containing protein [Sedimenticola sp.]|nr:DUF2325 domain-containing protein [Sedimenticola sp.]
MCDLSKKPFHPPERVRNGRRRLHQLDRAYHCTILGTCLNLQELYKVLRQSGITLPPGVSDYDAHRSLVGASGRGGHAAKRLQRFLDRKYQRSITGLGRCHDSQALEQAWQEAVKQGDIAGTFWALVTHPQSSDALLQKVYGEVHMLCHLAGASQRADLKRLAALESEVDALHSIAAGNSLKHQRQLLERDRLIAQLEQRMAEQKRVTRNQRYPDGDAIHQELQEMRRGHDRTQRQLERCRRRLDHVRRLARQLQQRLDSTELLLQESRGEHQAMEEMLADLLEHNGQDRRPDAADLRGRQGVYVGGRASLSPHFRALVKQLHGEFEHHDGGVEESRANLHCLLGKADMVFCPIDCVSHDACLKVKRFCKQHAKPFIPLRSSGLSAFARELTRIDQANTAATPN